MYDEEVRDYGFDLPDVRDEYIDIQGQSIKIMIKRNYYFNHEIEEMDYEIYWAILVNGKQSLLLPKGTDEEQASTVARTLFIEDEEHREEMQQIQIERQMRARGIEF